MPHYSPVGILIGTCRPEIGFYSKIANFLFCGHEICFYLTIINFPFPWHEIFQRFLIKFLLLHGHEFGQS